MSIKKAAIVGMLFACCLVVAGPGLAASWAPPQHTIDWYVMGGGGGLGESLNGTVGQAMVGPVGDQPLWVCAGFWCEGAAAGGIYEVYLPLVMRSY